MRFGGSVRPESLVVRRFRYLPYTLSLVLVASLPLAPGTARARSPAGCADLFAPEATAAQGVAHPEPGRDQVRHPGQCHR